MRTLPLLAAVVFVLLLLGSAVCRAQSVDGGAAAADTPKPAAAEHAAPEEILRQMTNYLGGLPAFSCRIESSMHVQQGSLDNLMVTKSTCRVERPRRVAVIVDEGLMGTTTVSDGKQLIQYLPATKRYVVKDAPDDIADLVGMPGLMSMSMGGMGSFALPVGGNRFYQQLMTGVTSSEYLGQEKIGDAMCHHLRFVQALFDWDIWIEQGDRPVIRKVAPDLSKELAQAGDSAKGTKVEMSFVFSDWNVAPKFTDADFVFTPPSGARKSDSLFGNSSDDEEEAPNPLLGQAAPSFKLKDLAQQEVDLASDLGKHVIILDFWATWCGPCCAALPIINEVATKYKERGVVFHAVNLQDDADTVTAFLKSKNLEVPVVLDSDGAVGSAYRAEAIPQTVLIGKDGKVQVVHVGFSESMAEEIGKQLDDLLEGKDLASVTLAEAKKAHESRAANHKSMKTIGATLAWTALNKSTGVAVDSTSDEAFGIELGGKAIAVDINGKTLHEFELGGGDTIVRCANLVGDAAPEFVTFRLWGPDVTAHSATGEKLWTYPGGQGVDDVWTADLDGNGFDEVIVGYNGKTGLHVLDHQGKLLWKTTDTGNVWHVAAGDFSQAGKTDVVSTAADGKLHVFDADGKKLKDVDVGFYADMVRMAPAVDKMTTATAIAAGSGEKGAVLADVDFSGKKKWELLLPTPDADHIDDLAVATTEPWAAVAMRGGLIHIIDLDSQQRVACVATEGLTPQLAWLPRPDKTPLLVIATGKELSAYEIEPTDVAAAEADAPAR
jgi:peroxiredoxin